MQLISRHLLGGSEIRSLCFRKPNADARRQAERSVRSIDLQVNTNELPTVEAFQFSGDRLHTDCRHFSSSIGLRTSDGRPRGSGVHRMLRPALVALLPLALVACEADTIAARATLTELGYHGIAIRPAPAFGRPCAWGEPFAARFQAVTEDGRIVAGTICAADETSRDARLLADKPEGTR